MDYVLVYYSKNEWIKEKPSDAEYKRNAKERGKTSNAISETYWDTFSKLKSDYSESSNVMHSAPVTNPIQCEILTSLKHPQDLSMLTSSTPSIYWL